MGVGDPWEQFRKIFSFASDAGYGVYIIAVIGLTALIIFFYVGGFIYRRMRKKRRWDDSLAMSFQDLDRMSGKGLLTPEELKKVRQAMSRQYLGAQEEKATVDDLTAVAAQALAQSNKGAGAAAKETPREKPKAPQASEERLDDMETQETPSLTELARQGRITREQFEALREVFEKENEEKR